MQAQSPELSAQDVNLLHQIVLRAQKQPEYQQHPNKTLFDAYEAIFAENGLDTRHDRACLRLLLLLGGPSVPGDTLYNKFEHILEKAGIVLHFDDDGSVANAPEENGSSDTSETVPTPSPKRHERRNSFTSVYDITADLRRIERPRRLSLEKGLSSPQRLAAPVSRIDDEQAVLQPRRILSQEVPDQVVAIPTFTADPLAAMAHQPLSRAQLEDEEQTRHHLAQIMSVAIKKDQLTLVRQAFANWRHGTRISRQQRRLGEVERALDAQREHIATRASETYNYALVAKAFCHWAFLSNTAKKRTERARRWYLRRKYFIAWQRLAVREEFQSQLVPKGVYFRKWLFKTTERQSEDDQVEERIRRMRDWRIARTCFDKWASRSGQFVVADQQYQRTLKQDLLKKIQLATLESKFRKCQHRQWKIDILYSWVYEYRFQLLARSQQHDQKRQTFELLVKSFREKRNLLAAREETVIKQRSRRLLRSTFECWKLQMNLQRERSRMALEFHNPKIELETLAKWRDRALNVQRQELRAQDAEFYFLTSKVLKRWNHRATAARKARVNEAYKHARRLVKVNSLQHALSTWHARLEHINQTHLQSLAKCDQKSRGMVQKSFVKWQIRTSQLQQHFHQSVAHDENALLKRTLRSFLDEARRLQNLDTRAAQFYSIRQSDICVVQLRKISMKAFEVKRRQQDANAMRARHFAKNTRIMLRHWSSKTRDITLVPQKPSPYSADQEPTDAGYATGTGTATAAGSFAETSAHAAASGTTLGATQRNEDWTAFDQDLIEVSVTPGYLNTPSKRAARVRALVNASTTPSSTPWTAQLGRSKFGPPSKREHLFQDIGG